MPNNLLIILSGPSGVGKDAVLRKMKELELPFYYAVTATTRSRRAGERQGVDYHFLSKDEFHRMMESSQLLESAEVYGNYYGVPKEEISQSLSEGKDVILKVDVQGATTFKKILPQAVFIFLKSPSMEELERRLRQRSSESGADLALRLEKAGEEIKSLLLFDYVVTNHQDKLDDVISQIQAIVVAEKCRVSTRIVKL